jgi:mannose-6-phosphate isomerase
MDEKRLLRDALRHPLRLPYHPLHRFYSGGSLVRTFRGIPDTPDDWRSEDWVGSCTVAGNPDPDGNQQGLSTVEIPEAGSVTLKSLIELFPEEMLGADFVERWGPTPGVLVKILSPAIPVPLHFHPDRAWARENLDSKFGKTEGWILLDTPGDGAEPAYFAAGFKEGVDRAWFREAIEQRQHKAMRDCLHRTQVYPGQVIVAHPGVPHCMGPQILSIELQEPTDHMVIAEYSGEDEAEATMGLGWDKALDIVDFSPTTKEAAFSKALQTPFVLREKGETREIRLVNEEVLEFFDATRLEVADVIHVEDGRYYVGIVTEGEGMIEGDFGSMPIHSGQSFVCAATLQHRIRVDEKPLRVIRCMGPSI